MKMTMIRLHPPSFKLSLSRHSSRSIRSNTIALSCRNT
jgi:hypothetical protein